MDYVDINAPVPLAHRYRSDQAERFSSLVNRATGCVTDRTGNPVCLDLIVEGETHRFSFASDEDLRTALALVKRARVPLSDHGAIVSMLAISTGGGLVILAILALVMRWA